MAIIKEEFFKKYSLKLEYDGFLRVIHKADCTLEIEDAIRQEKEIVAFCENKPMPFLIDVRAPNWNAPKEVRDFHANSKPLQKIRMAEAILVNSLAVRILANTYNKFNNPPNPVKVFTDEKRALYWIKNINTRMKKRKYFMLS